MSNDTQKDLPPDTTTKSFGTVLRDNPDVDNIAKRFPTLTRDMLIKDYKLPDTFDGRLIWSEALPPATEMYKCGRGWLVAAVECLSTRYNIYTPYQTNILIASVQPIYCPDPKLMDPIKISDNDSSIVLKNCVPCANTVYYALKYLYTKGCNLTPCMVYEDIINMKDVKRACEYPSVESISRDCKNVFGNDENSCFEKNRAMRRFRCSTFANVEDNEETIMREIYENGPVICSYLVYEDFVNSFDPSKSIYTGKQSSSRLLGGNSGMIVGWGEKNKIKYWIVGNFWSTYWGYQGYFYMERGRNVCEIEKNIVTVYPDLGVTYKVYPPAIAMLDPELNRIRSQYPIDPFNFYLPDTIKMIREGKLKGNLEPLWDIKLIPDIRIQKAGEIRKFPLFYKPNRIKTTYIILAIVIGLIFGIFFGYLSRRLLGGGKNRKRSRSRGRK